MLQMATETQTKRVRPLQKRTASDDGNLQLESLRNEITTRLDFFRKILEKEEKANDRFREDMRDSQGRIEKSNDQFRSYVRWMFGIMVTISVAAAIFAITT